MEKQLKDVMCNEACEIISRVTGYHRPLTLWNYGKQEEFRQRKAFKFSLNFDKNGNPDIVVKKHGKQSKKSI